MSEAFQRRIEPGTQVRPRELSAVSGERLPIPHPERLVHLQLRRFAGCPVCNLHLRSMVRRERAIADAGIQPIVVFHSTAEDLRIHVAEVPFALVADAEKRLYAEFGAEASLRALADPRAWPGIALAVAASFLGMLRGRPTPPLFPRGGRYRLPAEFLIARDGTVVACKYGEHADDQWSVDELLAHARAHPPSVAKVEMLPSQG